MASVVDAVLDRTVVLGYTQLAYRWRRRGWSPLPADAMAGRSVLVTGANSGLGKAAAGGLARLGARVHLLVRNRERGQAALDDLAARIPGSDLHLEVCDVSDLAQVAVFAAEFAQRHPGGLDVLVHNAGVFPEERQESPQGHETALATHVLGPHLLTHLLRPPLKRGKAGRVIWVSSGGMYGQKLTEDLEYSEDDYSGATAYARTKRMQVVLAEQWARELADDGVTVHSMHPGWADTPGVRSALPRFRLLTGPIIRTPGQGADTIVWLAAASQPAQTSGLFWHDRQPRPTHYLPITRESAGAREHLWSTCESATVDFR